MAREESTIGALLDETCGSIKTGPFGTKLKASEYTVTGVPVISVKPLAEQKAIAAVLGALDKKIELNRRMNATLEPMAWALFQSWFVDFDPVRAKLDGRQPAGMDEATAALFPDSFQDSTIGPLPKSWKATSLGEVVGRATDSGHGETELQKRFNIAEHRISNAADARISFTLPSARNRHNKSWSCERGFPLVFNHHAYACVANAFDAAVDQMERLSGVNENQSRSLATLRDTLLPKLLSGELSVAAATGQRDLAVPHEVS